MRLYVSLIFALILICIAGPTLADSRMALVIGNSDYRFAPRLRNPVNDASDVRVALGRLGFSVTSVPDAGYDAMRRGLVEFTRKAQHADVVVIFYAGHGMEVGGENWLIPTDAELRSDVEVETQAINLKALMAAVSNATTFGLIILDACRDNPFAATMRRTSRTNLVERGLARAQPSENVAVVYSAKDGTTALDGSGHNSPFTAALLRRIDTPGLGIFYLFGTVRDDVMEATRGKQQPFVYFYGSPPSRPIYLKPPLPGSLRDEDEIVWRTMREASASAEFDDLLSPENKRALEARAIGQFLAKFPSSPHTKDARARLKQLQAAGLGTSPPMQALSEDEVLWRTLKETAVAAQSDELFKNYSEARRVVEERAIEQFLVRFPRSRYAPEARARLQQLKKGGIPSVVSDGPKSPESVLSPKRLRFDRYVSGLDPEGWNWLALRTAPDPSAPWSPTIQIGPDTPLSLLGESGAFKLVQLRSGETGWVTGSHVICCRLVGSEPTYHFATDLCLTCKDGWLALSSGPGSQQWVQHLKLKPGAIFTVLGQSREFHHIRLPTSETGWVISSKVGCCR